jgi:hypothetical protein
MWDKRAYFKNYYLKHSEEMIERSKAWNEEHLGRNSKYYISEGADLQDRIKELEKENESLENVKNIYIGDLLKAKEIIRMVIDSYNHKERFSFEKDLIKAEQFLKED